MGAVWEQWCGHRHKRAWHLLFKATTWPLGQGVPGGSLGTSSGEPRFNAGLIKGAVGVPGCVDNPSH